MGITGLHFDGVDDHFYIADNAALDVANGLSMSIWIKRDYDDDGDTDEIGSVISSRENHFIFYIHHDMLHIYVEGIGLWTDVVEIPKQMLCHLVIVSIDSGSDHIQKVYQQGVLRNTKTWSGVNYPAATDTNLYVGCKYGSSNFLKGTVHHFMMSSDEWTQAEVIELWGSGTAADDVAAGDNWITRILVDEGTGTDLDNEEGVAGLDGVIAGTERWTSYAEKEMKGMRGITFDKTNMPEDGTFVIDRIQYRGTNAAHTCQVTDLAGCVIFNGLGTNDIQDLDCLVVKGLNVTTIDSGYVRVFFR